MPDKQTRESIEAELNASEVERAVRRCREVLHDIRELQRRLEEEEEERSWAITPLPDRPLVERMAAVGIGKEAIQQVSDMLDATKKLVSGRADEIPVGMRRGLAETADAGISALDQLQDILDARRQ
jgi:predicted transcriptional regulator YheO